jgi:preprotein translocase subunit YajC
MHALLHILANAPATTAKKQPSFLPTIIMMAIFAAVYFFFLRPKRQALKKQQALTRTFEVGDEVITIGGLVGTVLIIDEEEGRVLLSSGLGETQTHLMYLKQAIKGKAPVKAPETPAVGQGSDDNAGENEQ